MLIANLRALLDNPWVLNIGGTVIAAGVVGLLGMLFRRKRKAQRHELKVRDNAVLQAERLIVGNSTESLEPQAAQEHNVSVESGSRVVAKEMVVGTVHRQPRVEK